MKDGCYGCPDRTTICHGKDEQGNWRCKDWGKRQEAKAAKAKQIAQARDLKGYYGAKHVRIERKQKSHHT